MRTLNSAEIQAVSGGATPTDTPTAPPLWKTLLTRPLGVFAFFIFVYSGLVPG